MRSGGGNKGTFPNPNWDGGEGGEGWEEAVHIILQTVLNLSQRSIFSLSKGF